MRGLWRKDFYLGRQYLLLGAVIGGLLVFMAYWIRLAYIYGNLALLPEADRLESMQGLDMIFPVLPGMVLILLGIKAVNVSIYADRQAGWNLYLLAAPLGERAIVTTKYLEFLGTELCALTLGLGLAGVYGLFFGFEKARLGCLGLAAVLLLAVLCECVMLPLAYRCRSENVAVAAAFLGLVLSGYLAAGMVLLGASDPELLLLGLKTWCANHLGLMLAAALGIAALGLAVSYGITLRIVKKRVWCG